MQLTCRCMSESARRSSPQRVSIEDHYVRVNANSDGIRTRRASQLHSACDCELLRYSRRARRPTGRDAGDSALAPSSPNTSYRSADDMRVRGVLGAAWKEHCSRGVALARLELPTSECRHTEVASALGVHKMPALAWPSFEGGQGSRDISSSLLS